MSEITPELYKVDEEVYIIHPFLVSLIDHQFHLVELNLIVHFFFCPYCRVDHVTQGYDQLLILTHLTGCTGKGTIVVFLFGSFITSLA